MAVSPGRRLQLNGKFLAAAPTGVHRVAEELGNALADLIAEGHPAAAGLTLEVLAPANGMGRAVKLRMPARLVGPLVHIPWEQLTLPLRHGRGLLLNLCNIGPMLSRHSVTMIHDVQVLLSPESYRPAFRVWYRLVQPVIARRHRLILTVSEYSRQQIVRAGLAPASKVAVVHNGVDHVLAVSAEPGIVPRLGLAPGRFVVGLANVQAHKNIGVLLRAFADPALAGLTLVLFGSADRAAFQAAGHAVPDNVVFAGRISDGELRGLLEAALCLAFPSTTEGFGLPPLEAMLLGCPAVIAPCGALPEVCGDAALRAAADSPADWSMTIATLANDEAVRVGFAESGKKHAQTYTWRNAAVTLATHLSYI
jgi:glycosyltransferase involved in cell wall biosynthesis